MLSNRAFKLARKRVYIPVTGLNGYSIDLVTTNAATGTALTADAGVLNLNGTAQQLVGATATADRNARARALGNGNPRLVPIEALNLQALLLTTANDGVEFCGLIPYDLDRAKPVGIRAVWAHMAAAVSTRTITFTATHGLLASGGTIAAAATALGTPIAAQAPLVGTAPIFMRGTRGVMAANTIGATHLFWAWKLLMTAFDAAFTERKYLLGVELDYMPRWMYGPRVQYDQAPAGMEDWKA